MILLDVNVLVYAFKASEPGHDVYRRWLEQVLADGSERVGLAESAVSGFVRVVTSPRIYAVPAPSRLAADFVDAVVASGTASWLTPNDATWRAFRRIVDDDRAVTGNLVPDAWLAALAIAHGARVATADRGFGRFRGLDHFDPAH